MEATMSAATAMLPSNLARVAFRVRIAGRVQGVGFRPFVKRLADRHGLAGCVGNDAEGVFLDIEGECQQTRAFLGCLELEAPEAARIESVSVEPTDFLDRRYFEIVPCPPERPGPCRARVPRDRAVCDECLSEVRDQTNRRFRYPLTTCTTCGPRYTLVKTMPYQRDGTSMSGFPLCPTCAVEFGDAGDRRFHAEVMACARCGPRVAFHDSRSAAAFMDDDAVCRAADALRRGEIVALRDWAAFSC
jgi:hydrogenase maturation protein HypF